MPLPDESGPIEHQQKVRQLFEKALEQGESQRLAFLSSACGGDATLLQDVVHLLLANQQSASFLKTAPPTPKDKPPDNIGRYFVTGELGRGAMGIVYEARDPLIGRIVAIKTINIKAFSQPEEARFLQQQLLKEATAAGQLSHPNIVTIHDMGIEGEMAFIAMERMEGSSLQQMVPAGTKLDPAKSVALLAQCADALDYAHQNGIVHRDIKPANIMVNKGIQVKITDFGIAKNMLSAQQTGFGITLGTPSYMSPEQIRGDSLDGRSDQFSLAVVAYELLTGGKPFRGDTLPELLGTIREGSRPSAYAANPQLPATVDPVLQKALARLPKDRFATCAEFILALEPALNLQTVANTASHLPIITPITPPSKSPSSKVPAIITATVLSLAIVAATAYRFFFYHPAPEHYGSGTPGIPVVMLFSADPGSTGKSPSLRWDVHNATEVLITPDVGAVAASGTQDVSPAQTTTYQLSATGPAGTAQASATLTRPDKPSDKPSAFVVPARILSFEAVPPVVKKNGKFQLKWRVEGEISDLSIDHRVGSVHGDMYPASAAETTTYTLTARSASGIVTQQATIKVDTSTGIVPQPKPAPPDPAMVFESAVAMRDAGQPTEAVPLFRQAATAGEVRAMLELGKVFLAGHDVPQDYAQALTWFRKAAEAGNPSAMVFAGVMTSKGLGGPKDEAQAAAWFRKAADANYPSGMDSLGMMYATGQGVPKDPAEAVRWYQKAADFGSIAAMSHLAAAFESGTGVDRNLKGAIHWYQTAADKGDRDAAAHVRALTTASATAEVKPQPAPPEKLPPGSVPGNRNWVDSGVTLNAGDSLKIVAAGSILVTTNGQAVSVPPAGVTGASCSGRAIAPSSPCYSLIGKIGATGKPFALGGMRLITTPVPGRLFLGVNDSDPSSNSGYWTVALNVMQGAPTAPVAPVVSPAQLRLTGIRPGTISTSRSVKYTITGTGFTPRTVVQLVDIKVFIGTKPGVADYYPAEVSPDGASMTIYIGPMQGNPASVRLLAQQAKSSAALDVAVTR